MGKRTKITIGVAAAIVVAGGIGSAFSGSGSHAPGPRPPKAASARIYVRGGSCVADPANATLHFYVTIANSGGAAGKASVVPWRRFDDGSTNDGVWDQTVDLQVPARGSRGGRIDVSYNPRVQAPIECRASIGGDAAHYKELEVVR